MCSAPLLLCSSTHPAKKVNTVWRIIGFLIIHASSLIMLAAWRLYASKKCQVYVGKSALSHTLSESARANE